MPWLSLSNAQDAESYLALLVFITLGLLFSGLFLGLAFLRGGVKRNAEKDSPYECGFDASGELTAPFSLRYALMVLFTVFDIEIALLIPWAVNLRGLGWNAFYSVALFLGILTSAFLYEWRSGCLEWE